MYWHISAPSLRQNREDAARPARAAGQLDGRHDEEGACLGKLAEVGEVFQVIQSGAQRPAMHGEILRRAVVNIHGVDAQSARAALDQNLRSLDGKSREVHRSARILIAIARGIGPAYRPARAHQHDGAAWNAPVPRL